MLNKTGELYCVLECFWLDIEIAAQLCWKKEDEISVYENRFCNLIELLSSLISSLPCFCVSSLERRSG